MYFMHLIESDKRREEEKQEQQRLRDIEREERKLELAERRAQQERSNMMQQMLFAKIMGVSFDTIFSQNKQTQDGKRNGDDNEL